MSDVPSQETTTQPREPRRMLTIDQVLELVPVCRSTLFKMERKGTFPASVLISPNRRAWYADEVATWQMTRPTNNRISR
jgi:predicted DNA-binding transcriptional regulator AlpA